MSRTDLDVVMASGCASYHSSRRPHRGIGKASPHEKTETRDGVACDVWLGGVLKHYRRAA